MAILILIIEIVFTGLITLFFFVCAGRIFSRAWARHTVAKQRRMYETDYERGLRLEQRRLERQKPLSYSPKDLHRDEEDAIRRAKDFLG